jgi:hypothetical protein
MEYMNHKTIGIQYWPDWEMREQASEGRNNSLEAKYWQLPETPFYGGLQKLRVGLISILS